MLIDWQVSRMTHRPPFSHPSRAHPLNARGSCKTIPDAGVPSAQKAGGLSRRGTKRGSTFGRGRAGSLAASRLLNGRARGAIVKARVVRRLRSPGALRAHIGYFQRDGVTRDESQGKLFDAAGDEADGRAFAERCKDDRHHFRFIVSPMMRENSRACGRLPASTWD
jgi:hypothetical protein